MQRLILYSSGGPTALAEFFGDFILVNGMAWPKLEVEPRKYRFRLLNGSDSRFYVLEFRDDEINGSAQSFLQIGTDDGLLARPVPLTQLLIAPGERMDLVVDFSDFDGGEIFLRNFGPDSPFGGFPIDAGDVADPNNTGQIMMFDVSKPFTSDVPNAKVKEMSPLRMKIMPLKQDGATRQLALFEGRDNYGRLMPMLGTLEDGSLTWDDDITEYPVYKTNEVWEVYNATGDAHPIHLHLVSFQIINREPFTTVDDEGVPLDEPEVHPKDQTLHNGETGTGGILKEEDVILSGEVREPEENEKGWKDTAVMLPGEVTRVIARFDLLGRYVWHCHILSHEDHEMMRPFEVVPKSHPKLSGDVLATATEFSLDQNYPNPFNPSTTINFSIPTENTMVSLKIYNSIGQEVGTLINQVVPAGNHEVQFDATGLSSGVYFYRLTAGNFVENKKMIVMK
ncbi:MAG: multicopper oxidase domain-containing protein [Ignavibacteriaceae bacterium]